MRVILKRPDCAPEIGELADYDAMHDYVDGFIETVPLYIYSFRRIIIVCNDEFLFNGSEYNCTLSGVAFYGNIFICAIGIFNGEHDFVGLTDSEILFIRSNCFPSQRFRIKCLGGEDI